MIEVNVVYEREVPWTKWPWVNRIIGPWFALAACLTFIASLVPLGVAMLMTGRAAGTMLKRVGAIYERILG